MMGYWDLWAGSFLTFSFGLMIIVGILLFVFWILMIIDCVKRSFKNDIEKILWIVVMIFTGWIGAVVYYIAVRVYNPRGIAKK